MNFHSMVVKIQVLLQKIKIFILKNRVSTTIFTCCLITSIFTIPALFSLSNNSISPDTAAALPETPFRFTAAGDWGATANTTANLRAIASSGSAFTIAMGDLSYNQITPETAWCDYIKSNVGANHPFELVSGNHDSDEEHQGDINNYRQCLPDRIGGITGDYGKEYYYDYGGLARFIQISPGLTFQGNSYIYSAGSARYNWVANAIDSARAAGIKWVVVSAHKVCLNMGTKSCEMGADLNNLLISKKVDLVLLGHDHNYQRSKQLAHNGACTTVAANTYNSSCVADAGADNAYTKGGGTVFVISGTGGISLYNINTADSEAPYFAKWMGANSNGTYGFTQVDVSGDKLGVSFVRSAGGTFSDNFEITAGQPSPPPQTLTFAPTHDAYIAQASASTNYGTAQSIDADNDPVKQFLMKFNVSGVGSQRVTNAKLRLYTTNNSNKGGDFRKAASNNWFENSVTWANAPAASTTITRSLGPVSLNTWYEVDVTPLVSADGELSLRVTGASTDGAAYASKERVGFAPQLIVTVENTTPDTTPPTAPTNLTATAASSNQVNISWTASTDNVQVAGYRIYRNSSLIGTSTTTSYTDSTVQPSSTYSYYVVSYDGANNSSPQSPSADVTTPQTSAVTTLTFTSTDDAAIYQATPTTNYGSLQSLETDASPVRHILMKFNVSNVGSRQVKSAKLRLYATDPSSIGGQFKKLVSNSWSQTNVTWNNAPAAGTTTAGSLGAVGANKWVEVDVTSAVTGDGLVGFRTSSTSGDNVIYASKERAGFAPQLILTAQ